MLLEAKNIHFAYPKSQQLFSGANLGVDAGERVALIGPSGSGKSTLAQIIAGYIAPQSGEVLFDESPLPRTGFCPVQLIYQHPEQALNPRWKLGDSLHEAWSPAASFLNEIGISPEWLDRYPTELSGGELQRFAVARALAPGTRVVIADEITTMLDVISQAQIWRLILDQVQQRKLGLIAVTHNLELAKHISTRIIKIEDL